MKQNRRHVLTFDRSLTHLPRAGGQCARRLVATVAVVAMFGATGAAESATTVWKIDRTDVIGGRPVEKLGAPRVVDSPHGKAVEFAGKSDGLLLTGVSPLAGARQYTIEVLACPDVSDVEKQKFLHIQDGAQTRALLEQIMHPDGQWHLEAGVKSYIDGKPADRYLYDKTKAHACGQWYWIAMTWDGEQLTSYINGKLQVSKPVKLIPLRDDCVTGIGVRITKIDGLKGKIREVRLTPRVLPPEQLQQAP